MASVKLDRRTLGAVIGVVAIPVLAFGPNVVATRYTDGPGGASIRATRPDDGWRFIYDAARLSRGAELGSETRALERAREIWVSRPGARSVELVYQDSEGFPVPVPAGAVQPDPRVARAVPLARLGWVVTGRFGPDRPEQMIGLLDMRTGRVAWRIRPARRGA